jgi:hypothetical protein
MMSEKNSGEPGQFNISRVLILSAALVVLLGLLLFYFRQEPQETQAALNDTAVVQPTPSAQPAQDVASQDLQSEQAAKQILTALKRFQDATERKMTYDKYNEMLIHLNADLNDTLPTFLRHQPDDESFRQEVAGALRDYTAAQNWWKTVIRNSQVLTDADRTDRLKIEWGSAQTHIDNAEKLLQRENSVNSDR